jgi:N-acetylmuramic acid 6-phosphate etherase
MNDEPSPTEARNPRSAGLDTLATNELVALLVREQRESVDAVLARSERIAGVVEAIVSRLERGGRLHYVGAGTSGRLGVLDAAEMPPTFGTPHGLVCAHIAGGNDALVRAVEGAEDDAAAGEAAMRDHVRAGDAAIGLSASGGAAFVVAALRAARAASAYTVALVNAPQSPLAEAADVAIVLETGAEPIAGSTRMKAGTSQKIALNAISTAVMVRLGKVHDNLMIDVVAGNAKLRRRALRLVCELAGVDAARAQALLDRAGGNVKLAVVMERRGIGADDARSLLAHNGGVLRALL